MDAEFLNINLCSAMILFDLILFIPTKQYKEIIVTRRMLGIFQACNVT